MKIDGGFLVERGRGTGDSAIAPSYERGYGTYNVGTRSVKEKVYWL